MTSGVQSVANLVIDEAHMITKPIGNTAMSARFGFLFLLLAAISLAVTGCGRRGALDTPSQAAAEARDEKPSEEEPEEEDKPFILDGLIQ